MNAVDVTRREIARAMAGVRTAFRGVLGNLQVSTRIQRGDLSGLAGEQLPDMELLQQFGFTSAPPAGATVIAVPLGGRTSATVIVATEHGQYRLVVARGEAAVYSQWGDAVHLRADRTVHVKAATRVLVESPTAEFTGNVTVAGALQVTGAISTSSSVTASGAVTGQGKSLATHVHSGVTTGGGNTGAPV